MLLPRQIETLIYEASRRDAGDHAVIATDAAGTILYWNSLAELMYGWPSEEVLGRNILDVTPTQQSGEQAAEIMDQLRRGETWAGSFIVQRRGGTQLLAHVVDVPITHGGDIIGVVGLSKREIREPVTLR